MIADLLRTRQVIAADRICGWMVASRTLQFAICSMLSRILLQSPMAVRIMVVLALLFAFAYGFAKLVERYGGVSDRPAPCEKWSDCPDPNAPPLEPKPS